MARLDPFVADVLAAVGAEVFHHFLIIRRTLLRYRSPGPDGKMAPFHEAKAPRRTSVEMFDFHFLRYRYCLQSDRDRRNAPPTCSLLNDPLLKSFLQLWPPRLVSTETQLRLLHLSQLVFQLPPLSNHRLVDLEIPRRGSIPMFLRIADRLQFKLSFISVSLCHFRGC